MDWSGDPAMGTVRPFFIRVVTMVEVQKQAGPAQNYWEFNYQFAHGGGDKSSKRRESLNRKNERLLGNRFSLLGNRFSDPGASRCLSGGLERGAGGGRVQISFIDPI